ncbi:hypothetical protein HDU96_000515 [Phlyctochytrium bullatum]|nr:hypothetical protein HDU96_000515 [Phlyctochytrium bullatum]
MAHSKAKVPQGLPCLGIMNTLPPEVVERIFRSLASCDLQTAIDFELLQTGFDRRYYFRINSDPAAGPVSDAVVPLLPDAWKNLTEANFPISLAVSKFRFIEPHDNVQTVPAFKVAWIAKFRPDLFTYEYVKKVAQSGRLDLIRILKAYEIPKFCRGTYDEAAANGDLSMLKFLYSVRGYGQGCSAGAIDRAAAEGHLDVIRFLHEVHNEGCTDSALFHAATSGNLLVLEYLQTEMKQEPSESSYTDARVYYYQSLTVEFHVLRSLHEQLGWPVAQKLLPHILATAEPEEFRYYLERIRYLRPDMAAKMFSTSMKSWLPMLKVLHELQGDNDDIWVNSNWDELAKHGHGDMLEFLYENRHEGCTPNGLSSAARGGHVNVVKLLLSQGFKATQKLLEDAVISENVEMIKFCRSLPQLEGFWTTSLASYAAQYRCFKSLRYMWDEYGLGLQSLEPLELSWQTETQLDIALYAIQEGAIPSPEQSGFKSLLTLVCKFGTLEQIEAISKLTTEECPEVFETCCSEGRLDVLMLLCRIRKENPPLSCLTAAAKSWKLDVVKYLVKTIGMDLTADLLYHVAYCGDLEMVRELVDRLPADEVAGADALGAAIRGGHIEVAKFLHEKGLPVHTSLSEAITHMTSLDLFVFVIEESYYGYDTDPLESRAVEFFENIDITDQYFGYFSPMSPQTTGFFYHVPDLIQLACKLGMIDYESDPSDVFRVDSLRCFQILVSHYYVECNTKTAEDAAENGACRIIRYLSRLDPSIFEPSVLTKAITARPGYNDSSIVEFLLDKHPDCWVPDEHLTLEPGTLETALVLWTKIGWRACPRAVMVNACKQKLTGSLKACLQLMDPSSDVWKSAVEECLQVARSEEYFCEKAVEILVKACEA